MDFKFLLILLTASTASASLTLKGGDFACSEADGQEIKIPGITDVPTSVKIQCVCEKGVGKCRKVIDKCHDSLRGCHFIQDSFNSSCAKECRPCSSLLHSGQESVQLDKDNQCTSQVCLSGVVTRTNVQCATPMCPNPLPPGPGQCCPSCQGCSRAGQFFKEGETKADVLDPCNSCTCSKGRLECVKKACPVLPCSRNLVRYVKGQCCPICSRPVEYRSTPKSCLFRGRLYKAGQNIPISGDPCTKCKCQEDGQAVECTRNTCPALLCPAHLQVLSKGQCCPHCQEDKIGKALPVIWAGKQQCTFNGRTFQPGETWNSGCKSCTCLSNGQAHCQDTKCLIKSCPPGAELVRKEGQCCPTCQFNDGVCTVFGDPHYRTFDGRIFNFQGSCKYLLAKDGCGLERKKSNSSFSVRITNDARDSLAFSWTRTITVRLPEHDLKISLLQKMRVKINGKKVNLPYILLGKLSVMKDGYRVILRTNEGLKLLWDGVSFLEMTVPPKYRNQLCGLCGNFNGDKSDDFFKPMHTGPQAYQDGQHFGDSWRVGGLRACSVLPKDMPQSYEPECTQSWSSRIKSDRFCNAFKSQLFAQCVDKVDPEYYFNACKLDMCECPGDQCHCEVLTAYARECERAGQLIYGWRESTGCKNVSSFKYMGKHHNEVITEMPMMVSSTTTTTTTIATTTTVSTTTTTVMTTTSTTALPDWILGPYLPGCSAQTAEFCKRNQVMQRMEKRRRKRKEKMARKRARRKRRRRLRRLRNRRQRKRNKGKKRKQDHVFQVGKDFALTMRREKQLRKFEWSSLLGDSKKPPFEALLTSQKEDFQPQKSSENNHQEEFVELDASSYLEEISSSNFEKERGNKGGKRTPLPLKEASSEALVKDEKSDQRGWKRRKRK